MISDISYKLSLSDRRVAFTAKTTNFTTNHMPHVNHSLAVLSWSLDTDKICLRDPPDLPKDVEIMTPTEPVTQPSTQYGAQLAGARNLVYYLSEITTHDTAPGLTPWHILRERFKRKLIEPPHWYLVRTEISIRPILHSFQNILHPRMGKTPGPRHSKIKNRAMHQGETLTPSPQRSQQSHVQTHLNPTS